jgi:hypothetical protein
VLAFAVPAAAALAALAALPVAASASSHASSAAARANSAAVPATVIPATTHAVTAADIASVKTSGGAMTITVTAAPSVKAGDIMVAGIGPATPDGLIAKVTRVSGKTITATAATLRQAIPQGSFSATDTLAPVSSGTVAANLACGAGGGLVALGGSATVSVKPVISASWTAKSAAVTITATATGTSEAVANEIPPDYACSPSAYVGATTTLAPVQVLVKGIPIVVTPQLRWFLQSSVSTTQLVSVEVSQTFSAAGSLTDNAGHYTTHGGASVSHAVNVTGAPTFAPSRNLVSVAIGPAITMGLFGRSGPTVKIGLGAKLSTSSTALPWWTADATQLVTGTASTPDLALSSASKTMDNHAAVVQHGYTPTAGFSVYQSYGMQQGAVRGPGGRIWLISMMPPQWQGNPTGSQSIDAVTPNTGVVNYYAPLPPYVGSKTTLLAYDDGAPAFDGGGSAWMVATATTFGGAQSRYLVRYTPGPSTSATYKVPASCGSAGGATSAGDGAVWVTCGSNRVIRVTASGAMRVFSLSKVSSVGRLAAGAGGSMWAVGYNAGHAAIGLVRITSGGGEAYYPTPRGSTPRALAGNGSGRVIETATCGASVCLESVSTSGKLARVGTVPGTVHSIAGPSMDASGNVWLLVDGTASKTGQFWLRLTSGNKTQSYPFTVPGCGSALLTTAGNPAGSADGSAWIESTSNCTSIGNVASAYVGAILRFNP